MRRGKPSLLLWSTKQCHAAGLDPYEVEKLAVELEYLGKRMRAMGLIVYGGGGSAYLIHRSRPTHDDKERADKGSAVASIGAGYDGGDW